MFPTPFLPIPPLASRSDLTEVSTTYVTVAHSSARFPGLVGSQVLNIAPLRGTDPAQLFFNAASRKLTMRELEVESGYSQADLLKALQEHLVKAEGHPGTLVRGALAGWGCPDCVFRLIYCSCCCYCCGC